MVPHHNPTIAAALFAILAIMLYGVVLSRILPRRQHFAWNIVLAAGTVFIGYVAGLTFSDLGLSLGVPSRVLAVLIISLITGIVAVMAGPYVPVVRNLLRQSQWAHESRREILYAVLVRIPFSTGLLEEVLFRGVLFGLVLHIWNDVGAIVVSSIFFGLWHASPAAGELEGVRFPAPWMMRVRRYIALTLTVLATALAGAVFAGLRLWAASLLAPWLVHWAINATGVLAAARAGKVSKRVTRVGQR